MHQVGQLGGTANLPLSSVFGCIGLPFLALWCVVGLSGESEAEDEVKREEGWLRDNEEGSRWFM